jgi:hypothetical protein
MQKIASTAGSNKRLMKEEEGETKTTRRNIFNWLALPSGKVLEVEDMKKVDREREARL